MSLQGMFWFPLGLLFGSVLLGASAPATLEPHGCSDKEQQVTVSHTYKIDVPKSALVQVETDPQPLGDEGASLPAPGEAEEQNIIFRHNIRLQTPQKDCELAGSIQALLARVRKLEDEMAEVKEQCHVQRCCQASCEEKRLHSCQRIKYFALGVGGAVSHGVAFWYLPRLPLVQGLDAHHCIPPARFRPVASSHRQR